MTITEKVAYLKGLMEGLAFDPATKEGKVLQQMAEILEDMANEVTDMGKDVAELNDRMDEIDEDLSDVEDEIYGEDCDGDCENCDGCDDDEEDDDDESFYEITCSNCGEKIHVAEDVLDEGGMTCPKCGAELVFDVEYEDAGDKKPDDIPF